MKGENFITSAHTHCGLSSVQKKQIDKYLGSYLSNCKLLKLERYEAEFLGTSLSSHTASEISREAPMARAKMFEVRHFILDLPYSDERIFLYYHYVRGESVEKCAELLDTSRRSAFRLKNAALALAYLEAHRRGVV